MEYQHPDYINGGADGLRTRAATAGRIRLHALGAAPASASYGAAVAASLGYVAIAAADITSAPGSGTDYDQTLAGKAITLTAGDDGNNLHWAIVDSTDSKLLLCAKGAVPTEDKPMVAGGILTSPAFAFAHHEQPEQTG